MPLYRLKAHYQNIENTSRGYHGFYDDVDIFKSRLRGPIKENLLDIEERSRLLADLLSLQSDTGFSNSNLLADIITLQEEDVEAQNFRIGEAYAEIILEQKFSCRFHWNELRDARNPKGNKTGADLVGFIEIDNQVLFLFGEVKTSSETANRPPQVMTYSDGIENQLKSLYQNPKQRLILINYLNNKARLHQSDHPFKEDFNKAFQRYYSGDSNFQLFGVLVRDVDHDERDVSVSFEKLKRQILAPAGLQLIALYVPLTQSEWLATINDK